MQASSKRYLVILERGDNGYGAFSPDVPGCFAVGSTELETLERFQEALQDHIELLVEDGNEIPEPTTLAVPLDVQLRIPA